MATSLFVRKTNRFWGSWLCDSSIVQELRSIRPYQIFRA